MINSLHPGPGYNHSQMKNSLISHYHLLYIRNTTKKDTGTGKNTINSITNNTRTPIPLTGRNGQNSHQKKSKKEKGNSQNSTTNSIGKKSWKRKDSITKPTRKSSKKQTENITIIIKINNHGKTY